MQEPYSAELLWLSIPLRSNTPLSLASPVTFTCSFTKQSANKPNSEGSEGSVVPCQSNAPPPPAGAELSRQTVLSRESTAPLETWRPPPPKPSAMFPVKLLSEILTVGSSDNEIPPPLPSVAQRSNLQSVTLTLTPFPDAARPPPPALPLWHPENVEFSISAVSAKSDPDSRYTPPPDAPALQSKNLLPLKLTVSRLPALSSP
mmetsp:Transcript_16558/g.45111  ORF Transcript_16558/g.45111 Transcript_16558/m.45111 type:complete len:203 (-) Transcript_16558:3099-3707(-)